MFSLKPLLMFTVFLVVTSSLNAQLPNEEKSSTPPTEYTVYKGETFGFDPNGFDTKELFLIVVQSCSACHIMMEDISKLKAQEWKGEVSIYYMTDYAAREDFENEKQWLENLKLFKFIVKNSEGGIIHKEYPDWLPNKYRDAGTPVGRIDGSIFLGKLTANFERQNSPSGKEKQKERSQQEQRISGDEFPQFSLQLFFEFSDSDVNDIFFIRDDLVILHKFALFKYLASKVGQEEKISIQLLFSANVSLEKTQRFLEDFKRWLKAIDLYACTRIVFDSEQFKLPQDCFHAKPCGIFDNKKVITGDALLNLFQQAFENYKAQYKPTEDLDEFRIFNFGDCWWEKWNLKLGLSFEQIRPIFSNSTLNPNSETKIVFIKSITLDVCNQFRKTSTELSNKGGAHINFVIISPSKNNCQDAPSFRIIELPLDVYTFLKQQIGNVLVNQEGKILKHPGKNIERFMNDY